jgi:methylated-DNA-[protein]-cysteine S-methyltransferase
MATNPWPIIVPCHRVLATSSSAARRIGGFSSPGGTRTKAALLALEGVSVDDADRKTASTQQRLDF